MTKIFYLSSHAQRADKQQCQSNRSSEPTTLAANRERAIGNYLKKQMASSNLNRQAVMLLVQR
jgi:hypothetical protein